MTFMYLEYITWQLAVGKLLYIESVNTLVSSLGTRSDLSRQKLPLFYNKF